MNVLKEIRETFMLSQEEMAGFLNVSESMVCMAEKDFRTIRNRNWLRLMDLYMLYLNSVIHKEDMPNAKLASVLQQQEAKLTRKMQLETAYHNTRMVVMQGKLEEMTANYDKMLLWLNTVNKALANPTIEEQDRLWLSIQQSTVVKRMSTYSPAEQAKFQKRIDMVNAEVSANRGVLERLGKKEM